jgi:LysM repeat protein
MIVESLLALAAVAVVIGGLMVLRAHGGPGLAPQEASVALLLDEAPTPAPTFTRAPAATSTIEPPPPIEAAPVTTTITYTIVSGDTISGIAQQFDVGTDELVAANPETLGSPDSLRIGQQVVVPVVAPAVAEAAPDEAAGLVEAPPAVAASGESPAEAPAGPEAAVASSEVDAGLSAMLGVPVLAATPPAVGVEAPPDDAALGTRSAPRRAEDAVAAIERDQSAAVALEAPWPVAPAEGATVTGESPVLRWSSAGVLPAGAHYVLEIRGVDDPLGTDAKLVWIVSNATAARVPGDLRPPLGTARRFSWTVSVRTRTGRLLGEDAGELIGRASAPMTFDWAP